MYMMNLVQCIIAVALGVLTCSVLASGAAMEPSGPVGEKGEQVIRVVLKRIVDHTPDANEVLGLGEMKPKGTWEEVLAPDTLDLGDVICLEFPVPQTTEHYTIGQTTYTATFRGSTVVDLTPRETDSESGKHKYPFFMREHFKATKAPMRTCRRFIPDRLPRLP